MKTIFTFLMMLVALNTTSYAGIHPDSLTLNKKKERPQVEYMRNAPWKNSLFMTASVGGPTTAIAGLGINIHCFVALGVSFLSADSEFAAFFATLKLPHYKFRSVTPYFTFMSGGTLSFSPYGGNSSSAQLLLGGASFKIKDWFFFKVECGSRDLYLARGRRSDNDTGPVFNVGFDINFKGFRKKN